MVQLRCYTPCNYRCFHDISSLVAAGMLLSKLFPETVSIRLALRLTDTFVQDKLKLYSRACEFYVVFIT